MDPRIRSDVDPESAFAPSVRKKAWYRSVEMPFVWIGGCLVMILALFFLLFPWKNGIPEVEEKGTQAAVDLTEISGRLDRLAASVEALRMQRLLTGSEDGGQAELLETLRRMNADLSQQIAVLSKKVEGLQAAAPVPALRQAKETASVAPAPVTSVAVKAHSGTPPEVKTRRTAVPAREGAGGSPSEYRVQKGDTLFSIARKNRISLQVLLDANKMRQSDPIHPGQRLVIPR